VVVVPDVGALRSPGDRTEGVKSSGGERAGTQTEGGVRGLKALGARDLTYKLCFIATSVQVCVLPKSWNAYFPSERVRFAMNLDFLPVREGSLM
jgi:hypothetical protein